MMSPVSLYFPIKRITSKKREYTKNMWQIGDIPDEVGQLVQSIKNYCLLLQAYISNYQEKYDRLHHLVSPQHFTSCTNLIAIQQTSTHLDISRSFEKWPASTFTPCQSMAPWPQGLRATVSRNSLYLDSQESRSLWGHHASNWSPKE